jgi:mono/diheme cytochrome c family protein
MNQAGSHAKVGRYYAVASFGTLVLIVGVLSAMLTPGDWLTTGSFFDATFNPTMLPSLFFRLFLATSLAGIYSLIMFRLFGPEQPDGQRRIIPLLSRWLLVSAVLLILALIWYLAKIPAAATALLIWGVGFKSAAMFWGVNLAMMAAVLSLAAYLLWKRPKQAPWLAVAVIFVSGLFFTFEMEMARESARKPFVIHNYMYANGIRLQDSAAINQKGILPSARWSRVKEVTPDNKLAAGHEVYVMECSVCHTVDGVNSRRDMKKITAGWSQAAIDGYIANLNSFRSFMPPFFGTEKERQALTDWIYSLRGEKP